MAELWASADSRPIAILEPHYDDAWLNLGGAILLHPHLRFRIISISENPKNDLNETQYLSEVLPNVETAALRLRGIPWSFRGTLEEAIKEFCRMNELAGLKELGQRIDALVADCREIILPLGLEHAQHDIVSRIPCHSVEHVSFYREFPYFFPYFSTRAIGNSIKSVKNKLVHVFSLWKKIKKLNVQRIDIQSSLEKKIQLFKEVYTSQSFLLRTRRGSVTLLSMDDEILFRPVNTGHIVTLSNCINLFLYEFLNYDNSLDASL